MRLFIVLFLMLMHSIGWGNSGSVSVNFQDTTSMVITVITVIVALITFGITIIIPIALRVYRRYDRAIKSIDVQIEMVRKVEDLIAQYEIDTFVLNSSVMTLPRFTLRKHLQSLINPPAHDVVASQKLACTNLAQLVTNPKLIWPRKLKSLIKFMRINGLLSNELLRSQEYKSMLIKELRDFAEDDTHGEDSSRYLFSDTILRDFAYAFAVLLLLLFSLVSVIWMIKNIV